MPLLAVAVAFRPWALIRERFHEAVGAAADGSPGDNGYRAFLEVQWVPKNHLQSQVGGQFADYG